MKLICAKIHTITQSTKRKPFFCFDDFFNSQYKHLLRREEPQNCLGNSSTVGEVLGVNYQSWLEWFIGFAEGDGTFHISKKNLHFSVTQDEVFILNHIKDVLGFGKVRKFTGERKWVYYVEDRFSIYLLILIFNGNLVLDHRYTQFSRWVNAFNSLPFKGKTYKHSVKLKTNTVSPSLKDGWFSGFTDAEGYLGCIVETKRKHISHYVRVSFEISQNGEDWLFTHFKTLFKVGITASSKKGHNRYIVSGVRNCQVLVLYFENYNLKTAHKNRSFKLWIDICKSLQNKEHLNKALLPGLLDKVKLVNKFIKM